MLLDWEDPLCEPDYSRAIDNSRKCEDAWEGDATGGLALCLGTSLQMSPAGDWPCEAGKMVIVNLQETVKDEDACLVIRARADDVMYELMKELKLPIPVSLSCPTLQAMTFLC